MKNDTSLFSLKIIKILTNMQNFFFEILVQTALTVGLFWTILNLTPKSALLSYTVPSMHGWLTRQPTLIWTLNLRTQKKYNKKFVNQKLCRPLKHSSNYERTLVLDRVWKSSNPRGGGISWWLWRGSVVILDSFLTVWIRCETMVGDSRPKSVLAHESSSSSVSSNDDFNERRFI